MDEYQLRRFRQDMDGTMEPHQDGDWVLAEGADEMISRLRQEISKLRATVRSFRLPRE
jgi:hypothetical protein